MAASAASWRALAGRWAGLRAATARYWDCWAEDKLSVFGVPCMLWLTSLVLLAGWLAPSRLLAGCCFCFCWLAAWLGFTRLALSAWCRRPKNPNPTLELVSGRTCRARLALAGRLGLTRLARSLSLSAFVEGKRYDQKL